MSAAVGMAGLARPRVARQPGLRRRRLSHGFQNRLPRETESQTGRKRVAGGGRIDGLHFKAGNLMAFAIRAADDRSPGSPA